jgi:hypothetical protein
MAVDAHTARIIAAYFDADARTRTQTLARIERAWAALDSWRDADADRFVRAVVPIIQAGERQVANLTSAYLAQYAAHLFGGPFRPAALDPGAVTGTALRGVNPTEVYRRPFHTLWTTLSQGKSLVDAIDAGWARAKTLAATDLQLAKTHTARDVLGRDGRVVGYRRVLTGREDCGICTVAATQRYRKENLAAIHGGCDCGVQPIYAGRDPGQVIDPDGLDRVHESIAERFGADEVDATPHAAAYWSQIAVREHSELGLVLTLRRHSFQPQYLNELRSDYR